MYAFVHAAGESNASAPIPMKQNHTTRSGIAAFDVVKAHAVALDKDADRRVSPFRYHLEHDIAEDHRN